MVHSKTIYPRTGINRQFTFKNVISSPYIKVGDYTMYNDFVHDPKTLNKNNVLYQYPINHDNLTIGKFLFNRLWRKVFFFTGKSHLPVINISFSIIF